MPTGYLLLRRRDVGPYRCRASGRSRSCALGDLVLGQDTTTGKLEYRPVVTVFHNPPNVTYRIDLGGETVFPTGFHRFWKTGHGWIMARELKAGDQLRTVGGAVKVVSIAKDRVQPVFNLLLEGGDDFCVGRQGVIAHDNGLPAPVDHPFDGVPALADLGATTHALMRYRRRAKVRGLPFLRPPDFGSAPAQTYRRSSVRSHLGAVLVEEVEAAAGQPALEDDAVAVLVVGPVWIWACWAR